MTRSPACRPLRQLRRGRAVAAIWRCIASMWLAVIVSSGRSSHAVAIRCQ
jgi:hypothetical protein